MVVISAMECGVLVAAVCYSCGLVFGVDRAVASAASIAAMCVQCSLVVRQAWCAAVQ